MATCKICGKRTLLSGVTQDGNPLVDGVCHACLQPTANVTREKSRCHLCGETIADLGAGQTFYVTIGKAGIGLSNVESVSVTAKGESCHKCINLVQVRQLAAILFLVFGPFGLFTFSLPLVWFVGDVLGYKGTKSPLMELLPLIALGAPVLVIVCGLIFMPKLDALILRSAACKDAILQLQSSLSQPSSGFVAKEIVAFKTFVIGRQKVIDLPKVGEISGGSLQISDPAFAPPTSDELKEWGL